MKRQLSAASKGKDGNELRGVEYTSEKITDRVIRIRDGSDVCEYLVIGSKSAALIDTGYGFGDLKSYVESLTDKPYEVYITHGHVDHASGAGQFINVHMNHKDYEVFAEHTAIEFRKEVLRTQTGLELSDDEFIPAETEFINLIDGEIVDLGDITLQFVEVPGHTHGIMVPICPEEKIAFFGDACGIGVLLLLKESLSAEEYLESLKKLQSYEPIYNRVLRQHGTCCSTMNVLEDNIQNCENILNATDAHIPTEVLGHMCYWACEVDEHGKRKDGREGNIKYSLDHIRQKESN
ncbi:MAG: MBL fold metallo-hydrolase [Erysipelotrichia bacterium]|nr:MBL fold metallo-hydrolase [Erysipelotrichia bacterium]